MEDRFTYGLNPEKLGAVSSYLCDPNTAPAEFLLVKSQYLAETGRAVSRGALFFQIRQAFLPGEVTAEEANRIGYETAMRWTKGKYPGQVYSILLSYSILSPILCSETLATSKSHSTKNSV